jgi:hypothetical protein
MRSSTIVVIALIPLIAWRMYSRVRRLVGRQTSRAWRHWTAVVLFALLLAALGFGARSSAPAIEALAAGAAVGMALGRWGLRLTRFERTAEGLFYTPNAHIGIALSAVFFARIAWRIYELQAQAGPMRSNPDFARSPLTLLVFGMLAAYYTTYAAGVLRWRHSLRDAEPAP